MYELRPWTVKDARFICEVRNRPELMRWFRQDDPIRLKDQIEYIETSKRHRYPGKIALKDKKPVGVCALRDHNVEKELCIAAPFEHHRSITELLLEGCQSIVFGEVFIGNPCLKAYLDCGFEIVGVEEKAYFKKDIGPVDTIKIQWRPKS